MARAAKKAAESGPKLTMTEFAPGDEGAALAAAGAQAGALSMIPVDAIRVAPGFNIRFVDTPAYKAVVEQISRSIAAEGFYPSKPLAGFVSKDGDQDVVIVTDGHRRLAAAKLAIENGAEVASLPVVLKPAGTTMRQLTVALHKENTGTPNTMAENAVIAKRLMKDGMTETEIAAELDFSERYVQDLQILIGASKAVRDLVKRDRIAGTTAVLLLRKHRKDPGKAEAEMVRMAERAEARALSRGAKPEEAKLARASAKDSSSGTKTGRVAVVPGEDDELDEAAPAGAGKLRAKTRQIKVEWAADEGHRFELAEVRTWAKLLPDADWYQPDPNGTHAVAVEPIRFRAVIERAAERPVAAAPAPTIRKRSKRAQAAYEAAQQDDEEPAGVDVTSSLHDAALSDAPEMSAEDAVKWGEEPLDAEADRARELENADL